jgi:hypothetical protein
MAAISLPLPKLIWRFETAMYQLFRLGQDDIRRILATFGVFSLTHGLTMDKPDITI